jgi:hypothetical protein
MKSGNSMRAGVPGASRPRLLAVLLLTPLLGAVLALAGCGGSGSASTASTAESAPGVATNSSSKGAAPTSASESSLAAESGPSGGGGSESSESAQARHETPEASIEGYGSPAQGALRAQIAKDAFAFFESMAARRYAAVCAGLSAANRKELQAFLKTKHKSGSGGCATILSTLLARAAPEAKRAARGVLMAVRVKESTAIVIFRPKGGAPSYFALRREGSTWKAISLAPGTPLNPTAGAP